MSDSFWIQSKQVLTEEGLQSAAVLVCDGKIKSIAQQADDSAPLIETEHYLIPGMIDMHIHGACDADVMDASSESLRTISKALAREGATAFLATTMTESVDKISAALKAVSSRMSEQQGAEGAQILGVHLEGPFIAAEKMGAQNAQHIQDPNVEMLSEWVQHSGAQIALVTLAPEKPGSQALIEFCQQHGIVASIGHSNASFKQAKQSFDDGITHATHLYNAMSGVSHRDPGAAAAILDDERVLAELIADGVHVDKDICALTLKLKGEDHLALVTDAMRAKCMPDGEYSLGGQTVCVKDNAARLSDGTLAGGVLTMNQALKNILQFSGCSMETAVKLTATNPAKQLGVFDHKGSIAVGKDADLVILNNECEVVSTWCRGQLAYQNSNKGDKR